MIDTSPESLMRLLADLGKTLNSGQPREGVKQGLASVCGFLGARRGVIALWDESLEALQIRAGWNFAMDDVAAYNEWYRSVRGGAPLADAFFQEKAVVIPDVHADSCPPEYRYLRGWTDKYAMVGMVAVPLAYSGTTYGAMSFLFEEPHEFGRAVRDLLSAVAGQFTVAIQFAAARDTAEDHRRRLIRQHALLERVIDNAPWVVAYFNRDLVFEWVNPAALRLSPVPGETFVGRRLHEVFPQIEWPNPRFEAALREGRSVHVRTNPLRTTYQGMEKTTYWDMVVSPVPGEGGELAGVLLLCLDVTERVEAERRQQSRIEQLEELDRLKRDFLNVASHELRTPLSSILGYAEFLEDEIAGPLTGGQGEFVVQILESTRRLRAIVDDILDFARIEAGKFHLSMRDCDLGAVVEGAALSLLPQASGAGIDLTCKVPARPLALTCDPERVGQVVLNLVGNAVKFTDRGGRVAVSLRRRGSEAVVKVSDTGIGIAPDHMSRLFEKFFQVDPSNTRMRGGVGLGLAICRSLVEAHDGRIWASSTPGAGSTFEFALPIG